MFFPGNIPNESRILNCSLFGGTGQLCFMGIPTGMPTSSFLGDLARESIYHVLLFLQQALCVLCCSHLCVNITLESWQALGFNSHSRRRALSDFKWKGIVCLSLIQDNLGGKVVSRCLEYLVFLKVSSEKHFSWMTYFLAKQQQKIVVGVARHGGGGRSVVIFRVWQNWVLIPAIPNTSFLITGDH